MIALAFALSLGCRAEPLSATPKKSMIQSPVRLPSDVRRTIEVMPRSSPSAKDLPDIRLDPAGAWAVAGCGEPKVSVWQLGSGDYLGYYAASAAGPSSSPIWAELGECANWPALAKVDSDQEWIELSPDKLQRARLSADLTTLQIFEGAGLAPKLRIAIPVDPERGELLDGFAIRGAERVLVVRVRGQTHSCCRDDGSSYEVWSWSIEEGLELSETLNWETDWELDENQDVSGWYVSHDRRWLFAAVADNPYGGSIAEYELGQGASGLASLGDSESDADSYSMGYRPVEESEWLSGTATAWVTTPAAQPWELTQASVTWTAIQISPSFNMGSGVLIEDVLGYPETMDWTRVGFEGEHLLHSWALCWASGLDYGRLGPRVKMLDSRCVGERPTGACKLLGAGPGGRELLAQCDDGVRVGPPATTPEELTPTFSGRVTGFAWTRGGLIVATEDELWRVGADGATRVPELAQVRIVDARLASEVGLVLIESGGEMLILDAAEGRVVTRLGSLEIVDAAFARAAWTVDPSWRFAADDDGTFSRTLDFVTLSLVDQASFTDTGLFDGSAEDLDDWRLVFVEHPDWGAHRFGELSALVHHPNLAADFFAGLSLPSPETPSHKPSGVD